MKSFKRAVLYITRNRGRSIILAIVFTVLFILLTVGLSIGSGTQEAAAGLRRNLGGYFKIESDVSAAGGNQTINKDLAENVLALPGVTAYDGLDLYFLKVDDLVLLPGYFTLKGETKAQVARFIGNTDSSVNEYFLTGTFKLLKGRHIRPNEQGKALISSTLADMNHLEIGDTFTAWISEDSSGEGVDIAEQSFEYEVVGIYQANSALAYSERTPESDIADNFIFTDMNSARAAVSAMGGATDRFRYGVVFSVEDPEDLSEIVQNVQNLEGYDTGVLTITINDKIYRDALSPLQTLQGFVQALIVIILAVSAVLISLILVIWMKDRVREIGIYISIGYSKLHIFGQYLLECALIAALAAALAWGGSALAAAPVQNWAQENIRSQQILTEETQDDIQSVVGPDVSAPANTAALRVDIGIREWLAAVALGFASVFISVGLSFLMVVRMQPKKILSDMS